MGIARIKRVEFLRPRKSYFPSFRPTQEKKARLFSLNILFLPFTLKFLLANDETLRHYGYISFNLLISPRPVIDRFVSSCIAFAHVVLD